jgi:DNA-binding transcriptional MocR family regulator
MTIWLPNLAGRSGPKHRAISEAIGESIVDGSLEPEGKLPPQRELAYALGLSLGTVTRAYKEAARRGFVTGETGRGTYVCCKGDARVAKSLWGPARGEDGPINFVMNLPPVGIAAPELARTFASLGTSKDLGQLLDHQSTGRIEGHMRAAANWVGRQGLDATGDEIILTNGAQHGILANCGFMRSRWMRGGSFPMPWMRHAGLRGRRFSTACRRCIPQPVRKRDGARSPRSQAIKG